MKLKTIIICILLSGCSYSKRIETLEANDKEIVKAINCVVDEKCLEHVRAKNVKQ